MVFRSFYIRMLMRVLLLAASIFLVSYCLLQELYLRGAYVFLLVCLQITELLLFSSRFTRNVTSFIESIRARDFSIHFSEHSHDRLFQKLHTSLNDLMKSYKIISAEKEVEHQYLGMLVDHISFGVASFNRSGKILLVNNAFLKIAGIPHLHTVEQLQRKNNPLFEEIRSLESGRKKLIKLTQDHQMMTLALYASSFKLEDEVFTIISIQNISNEISATEIEAWQRLIKVLTHEIMNSVSPIISLSNSLHELTDMHGTGAEQSTLLKGLDAIKTRSESLMLFTQRYRKLIQIPPLDFKTVYISDVVERLLLLIEPMLKQKGIHAQKNLSPVVARLDPVLIEQAILNILQNAIDAVENAEAPAIEVIVGQEQKQITISISDNGKGIGSHDLDKIFIPFYTTKKDGSGVGLALARQIVLMHGGQIFVKSELNRGSTFIIVL